MFEDILQKNVSKESLISILVDKLMNEVTRDKLEKKVRDELSGFQCSSGDHVKMAYSLIVDVDIVV